MIDTPASFRDLHNWGCEELAPCSLLHPEQHLLLSDSHKHFLPSHAQSSVCVCEWVYVYVSVSVSLGQHQPPWFLPGAISLHLLHEKVIGCSIKLTSSCPQTSSNCRFQTLPPLPFTLALEEVMKYRGSFSTSGCFQCTVSNYFQAHVAPRISTPWPWLFLVTGCQGVRGLNPEAIPEGCTPPSTAKVWHYMNQCFQETIKAAPILLLPVLAAGEVFPCYHGRLRKRVPERKVAVPAKKHRPGEASALQHCAGSTGHFQHKSWPQTTSAAGGCPHTGPE